MVGWAHLRQWKRAPCAHRISPVSRCNTSGWIVYDVLIVAKYGQIVGIYW